MGWRTAAIGSFTVLRATVRRPGRPPRYFFAREIEELRGEVEALLLRGGGRGELHAVHLVGPLHGPLDVLKTYGATSKGLLVAVGEAMPCQTCAGCRVGREEGRSCESPRRIRWVPATTTHASPTPSARP